MSEPFDFEAFIAGTQLPRRTISVYRIDNTAEIKRLEAEHDRLPDTSGDEREGTPASPRFKIAKQIAALREAMEASRAEFVIRTLTPEEFKELSENESLDVYDQFAIQSVEPKLTADQWRQVANAVGASQWSALAKDANDLILSKVAVPDFSQSVSTTLNPQASSQN